MRKRKSTSRLRPYAVGLGAGYLSALIICAAEAAVLAIVGTASAAGAAAVVACCVGSYVCGRVAGGIKKHDGLKTGALCGVAFSLPLVIIAAVLGMFDIVMALLRCALFVVFSSAGGVKSVN